MSSRAITRVIALLMLLGSLFALQLFYGQMTRLQEVRNDTGKEKETVIYEMGPDVQEMLRAQALAEREQEEARRLAEERKRAAQRAKAEEAARAKGETSRTGPESESGQDAEGGRPASETDSNAMGEDPEPSGKVAQTNSRRH